MLWLHHSIPSTWPWQGCQFLQTQTSFSWLATEIIFRYIQLRCLPLVRSPHNNKKKESPKVNPLGKGISLHASQPAWPKSLGLLWPPWERTIRKCILFNLILFPGSRRRLVLWWRVRAMLSSRAKDFKVCHVLLVPPGETQIHEPTLSRSHSHTHSPAYPGWVPETGPGACRSICFYTSHVDDGVEEAWGLLNHVWGLLGQEYEVSAIRSHVC